MRGAMYAGSFLGTVPYGDMLRREVCGIIDYCYQIDLQK